MQDAGVIKQDIGIRRAPASSRKSAAIYLTWGSLLIFRGVADLKIHSAPSSYTFFVVAVCLPILLGLVLSLLGLFLVFGIISIGSIGYEEIVDLRIEQRVRARYGSEIDQLTSLGFSYAFTSGETLSLSRILLIYPAVILLQMRAHGAVLALGGGGKIVIGSPVLSSTDGRAFGHPQSLGVSFCTVFRDGPLLVTKNYKSLCGASPECVLQASAGTIAQAWQAHKERVKTLDTVTNPARTLRGYEAYADIAHREDTFVKSQR